MNIRIFFTVLGLLSALCVWSQQTERRYLSGTGLDDGVTWQFIVPRVGTAGSGVR